MARARAVRPGSGPRPARARSVQSSLGSIVLGFELIVVFLGALVVFGLKALPAAWALGGGAAMVLAMAATIGLMRFRWAFAVGWILQLIVVASGFLNPVLFIVGVLFTALWAYCMITGAKLDRQSPQQPQPQPQHEQPDQPQPKHPDQPQHPQHPSPPSPPDAPPTETETPS